MTTNIDYIKIHYFITEKGDCERYCDFEAALLADDHLNSLYLSMKLAECSFNKYVEQMAEKQEEE